MTEVLTFPRESSIGFKAVSLRLHLQWTQQELADIDPKVKMAIEAYESIKGDEALMKQFHAYLAGDKEG